MSIGPPEKGTPLDLNAMQRQDAIIQEQNKRIAELEQNVSMHEACRNSLILANERIAELEGALEEKIYPKCNCDKCTGSGIDALYD